MLWESADCTVLPFGKAEIDHLAFELDIHDSVIVASIMAWQRQTGELATLITRDERIAKSGLVKTLW